MEPDEQHDPGLKLKQADSLHRNEQLQEEIEIVIVNADGSNARSHLDEDDNDNSSSENEARTSEEEEEDDDEEDDDEIPDESLGTTIIREIQDGTYICLVCTGEIDKDSKIWTCEECFRVYDLDCIQDWAIRGSSTKNKTWRCPSCNSSIKKIPRKFTCWCGKITDPEKNPLMPFSCGNSCNYKYEDCIHNCLNVCHPGKHPICGAMGPMMRCKCGKEERQLPCLITPYDDGWRCEDECNIKICDLNHKCQKGCHSGFVGYVMK